MRSDAASDPGRQNRPVVTMRVARKLARVVTPILAQWSDNLERVERLIAMHGELPPGPSREINRDDLLRAAVVLLHATLEDALRTMSAMYLPQAGEDALNRVPLVGSSTDFRPEKFFLGSLAKHRGKSVDQVLRDSVEAHLARRTYNNTAEIAACLEQIGMPADADLQELFSAIDALMRRRHQIVHRADWVDGRLGRIGASTVIKWLRVVKQLRVQLVARVLHAEHRRLAPKSSRK